MNQCQFKSSTGKICTNRKRASNCPLNHFFCKKHIGQKTVKNMLEYEALYDNKNPNVVKNPHKKVKTVPKNNEISQIFNKEQAKESLFRILGDNSDEVAHTNQNLQGNPMEILENILRSDDDETLTKKQLKSKSIVDKAVSQNNQSEEAYEEEHEPKKKTGLSVACMLETSYWITMAAVEQRSLKLKGLTDNLKSNEPLNDHLELAFKEILLFMGLDEELGVESPCLVVFIATGQVMLTTLLMNGALLDFIEPFFAKKDDTIENKQVSQIMINEQKYADIF